MVCCMYLWIFYLSEVFVGVPFPLSGLMWFANGFYTAQIFGLIFLAFIYLKRHTSISPLLIFPSIAVCFWSFFPNLFYFTMGNGTSGFLTAVQGTEFTGVFGLDFMLALVNIVAYRIFQRPFQRSDSRNLVIAVVVIAVWFGYGVFSLNQ